VKDKKDERSIVSKEKIGYGMGDAASHIIFDNVMLYMMFFYTDIFGIPAGFVGTMFLLARALDAISDPCMGLIADRTRSRWGKFRPWILFGAIPFGIVCVLAYTTPDLSLNGKMVYAAVTYTLLTLLYTVVNIPYCALGGVITNDPTQRISLQSWRFVLATAGGMLSTVLMMPLVNLIGGDDKAFGFQGGIAVLSVVAFLMLAFCFFTTKERIQVPPSTTSMREDLRDIWHNDQWRIVGVLTILNILAVCVRGGDDVLLHLDHGLAGGVRRLPHHLLRRQPDRLRAGETAHRLEVQGQHLLVDQRRAGGGQRGDVLRADARHRADVRLYLRHRRAAPAGDADSVGDDVRYRRLRRMD
jgi:GPH family glycoside/pentoside/hexuronide:cation symporter